MPGLYSEDSPHPLFELNYPQAYVSQLASVPEQALSNAGVKIAVIGCGDWQLIENYKSTYLTHHVFVSS